MNIIKYTQYAYSVTVDKAVIKKTNSKLIRQYLTLQLVISEHFVNPKVINGGNNTVNNKSIRDI